MCLILFYYFKTLSSAIISETASSKLSISENENSDVKREALNQSFLYTNPSFCFNPKTISFF